MTIRNNVATLCCAKNRRCESFRVTSPLNSKLSVIAGKQQLVPWVDGGYYIQLVQSASPSPLDCIWCRELKHIHPLQNVE